MTFTMSDGSTVKDTLGVEINFGDTVRITSWGWNVRLQDVGRSFAVTGATWARNLLHGTDVADGLPVKSSCVGVVRRDGENGFEGNKP